MPVGLCAGRLRRRGGEGGRALPPCQDPVLELRDLCVDPGAGAACVAERYEAGQLPLAVAVGADQRPTRVAIASCVTGAASTDHVVCDVSGEDLLALGPAVQRQLRPLQCVGEEQPAAVGQTPASAVTDGVHWDLGVTWTEPLDGLDIGVRKVEWL